MRDSKIILSKKMLMDKNYKNVLNFTNEQILNIMQSNEHLVGKAEDYSFIKESTNTILVNFTYNQCLTANYIAFQNPRYSSKWFFAWIDSVEYYSEKATKITFTIDNWSTWFEKLEFKTAYILREHVNDDIIGRHRIEENLDVGFPVAIGSQEDISYSQNSWICAFSAWKPDTKTGYDGIAVYNGSISGKSAILFQNNLNGWRQLLYYILQTNADGHIADMTDLFIVPSVGIEQSQLEQHVYDVVIGGQTVVEDAYYYTMQYSAESKKFNTVIQKKYQWGDFTPKNKKCYCYPYNYILVSNNNGSQNIYRYESFEGQNDCTFENRFCFGIGGSGQLVPLNYKNMSICDDESLALGKYPTCSWSADSYTNWLVSQAVNIPTQWLGIATGAITGMTSQIGAMNQQTAYSPNLASGAFGVAGNLATQIGQQIGQFYSASLMPPIQGGGNTGDVVFNSGRNTFSFRFMRCPVENLRIIDDYFTRFGYKIDRIKIPNITGRENFNYIEIGQGENFAYGEVPANSLYEINQIARNGVTIWHNHENIGNYDVSNNIV